MTKAEVISKLEQIIKNIDTYYASLKEKFPNCENDLECQSFISYSQFIKTDCITKLNQYRNMDEDSFSKLNISFIMKNLDTSMKSIEIHFKTLMNNYVQYTPSDPNKIAPRLSDKKKRTYKLTKNEKKVLSNKIENNDKDLGMEL